MRLSSPALSSSPPPRRSKFRRRRPPKPPSPSPSHQTDPSPSDQESLYSSSSSIHPQSQSQSQSQSATATDDYSESTSTYVNIAPLPIFRGAPGECPFSHLSRFHRVCRANNAASLPFILRLFPATLDGDAALWHDLSVEPRLPSLSWDDIQSSFLDAFRPADFLDRARSDLIAIKQRESETVTAFHLRIQWILKRWPDHGLPDSLLMGIFVDGLREDFQDWIVPQRPETLEEAVGMAVGWERAARGREARRAVTMVRCGFCGGDGHEERGCEVRRRMRELWMKSRKVGGGCDGGGGEVGEDRKGKEEELVGEGEVVSLGRRAGGQCQCWKHQCWKKYERSGSGLGGTERNAVAPLVDQ